MRIAVHTVGVGSVFNWHFCPQLSTIREQSPFFWNISARHSQQDLATSIFVLLVLGLIDCSSERIDSIMVLLPDCSREDIAIAVTGLVVLDAVGWGLCLVLIAFLVLGYSTNISD